MHLRNGDHGYGVVTKLLHWVTVAALTAQFAVGWSMDLDDRLDAARVRRPKALSIEEAMLKMKLEQESGAQTEENGE